MKIKYAKRRITNHFVTSLLMLLIGLHWIKSSDIFVGFVWIFFALLQAGWAFYAKKMQYLTIEDNKLKRHSLIPKTIEIKNIQKVWKYVNSYKIETSDKTLILDKNIIEDESLFLLKDYLNNLNLRVSGLGLFKF